MTFQQGLNHIRAKLGIAPKSAHELFSRCIASEGDMAASADDVMAAFERE